MAKNYQQLAEQIIPLVGDKENIKAVRHCQTRLRFTLADESKADDKALEALDGVRKVLRSAGVYQVVIGTDVADLFAVLEPLCGLDNASDKAEDAPAEKKNPVSVIIDFVAGTFQPIIPALSGAGMLKALMALLVVFKFIDTSSQTYYIFNFFADAAFPAHPHRLLRGQKAQVQSHPGRNGRRHHDAPQLDQPGVCGRGCQVL